MNCPTGKQPFTQAQAADKARRASRRYSTGFSAYQCGAWHFGHHYSHKQQLPVIRRDHHIHSGPMRADSF